MKFTSEDLLKAMGLKVGQTLKFNHGIFKLVVGSKKNIIILKSEHKDIGLGILIDEEYTIIQPKPTLIEDEKAILRNLPKEYKYVARDSYGKGGNLVLCKEFPERNWVLIGGDGYWLENRNQFPCSTLGIFNHLFQFIKWEDGPYSIEELLKE